MIKKYQLYFVFLSFFVIFVKHSVASENYNIILITVDALRVDHLSCYGYFRNTSPNIDKLAKEGILFKNNFSQASYTLPSMMSIHTSLYPRSHGVFYVGRDKLTSNIKTLAEILNESGYTTAYFFDTNNLHMDIRIGFGRGFEHIANIYLPGKRFFIGKEKGKIFKWISNMKHKNFFLSYHNLNIHAPYLPSLKYKKKFAKDYRKNIVSFVKELQNIQIQLIKSDLKNSQSEIHKILKDEEELYPKIFYGKFNQKKMIELFKLVNSSSIQKRISFWHIYDPELIQLSKVNKNNPIDIQYLKNLYDACILEFDCEFIKPLIDKLKQLNLYDKTMIIMTADHGEEFMEHGDLGHRNRKLYDELIHTPLIIKLPKGIHYYQSRIEELTQNIDIMPTVLDTLNISIPQQVQGISLKGLWEAREDALINKYAYAQNGNRESIRSNGYKLISNILQSQNEFYNLKEGPGEKNNLYHQKAGILKQVEEDLHQYQKTLPYSADKESEFLPGIDETSRERIQKTGYW